MQSDEREAAYRICSDEEVIGAMGLINHLAKACFAQGLANERIQTIVRAKGESVALSVCIDTALEEESAILSVKERGIASHKMHQGPGVSPKETESHKGWEKGTRVSGFANRGMLRHGRGVSSEMSKDAGFTAHVVTGTTGTRIKCYACGALATSRNIARRRVHGEKVIRETRGWDRGAAPLGPSCSYGLYSNGRLSPKYSNIRDKCRG
jgi:hypothetical protein